MTSYEFTLIVEGADLQDDTHIEALFAAGCDDATVGRVGGVQYVDSDREAGSLPSAVVAAVNVIETAVLGARVVHVEPDGLVSMAEIAERTGRTRESVRLLISAERGPGGFPAPVTHFRRRQRMWRWQQVAVWFAQVLDEPQLVGDPGTAQFITAFNAGLAWRQVDDDLNPEDRERVRTLVG
ncbi:MAG TPA: hypothetical protein VGC11_08295 [Acidimicrobiia bacterium]|jgi:hypothetical protein